MARDNFFGGVDGADDLVRTLQQMSAEYGPKNAHVAFNEPLKQAWEPVYKYIERETPVDSGNLKESSTLRVGVPTRKERNGRHVSRTTGAVARAGWFWGGRYGRKTNSHQALAVEYGTNTQDGQRVLRRAFNQNRSAALRVFGKTAGQALTRRANQLSRRRARGRLRIR